MLVKESAERHAAHSFHKIGRHSIHQVAVHVLCTDRFSDWQVSYIPCDRLRCIWLLSSYTKVRKIMAIF